MNLVPSLLCLTLLATSALAQTEVPQVRQRIRTINPGDASAAAASHLGANYQVTLSLREQDVAPVDVSVVTALRTFTTNIVEQSLTLTGTLEVQEDGTVLCSYTMQWAPNTGPAKAENTPQNVVQQQRLSSVQGSVLAADGKEIVIFSAGTRTAKLAVRKLEEGAAAASPR